MATGLTVSFMLQLIQESLEGGSYPQAIINLGKDLNVPVVDMTSLTKKLYDSLGAAETVNLHAWTSSKPESVDNTHTNIWGGTYNAYLVTKTIKELNVAGLAEHIIDAKAPTKSDVLKSNPDYKESEYSNDLKDSELWANARESLRELYLEMLAAMIR